MENRNEFALIRGIFLPEDAANLLFSFINYKINFHHMEIFSLKERDSGADTSANEKRVAELKASRELVKDLIEEARRQNQRLILNSSIRIELTRE